MYCNCSHRNKMFTKVGRINRLPLFSLLFPQNSKKGFSEKGTASKERHLFVVQEFIAYKGLGILGQIAYFNGSLSDSN